MLAGVSLALSRTAIVTILSRTAEGFRSLLLHTPSLSPPSEGGRLAQRLRHLSIDYRDTAMVEEGLETSMRNDGPIDIVVSWVHTTAPRTPLLIGRVVAARKRGVRFIDVLGSRFATREAQIERRGEFSSVTHLDYCQVVLGHVNEPTGRRWLTHQEICDGVLEGVMGNESFVVVGELGEG